MAERWKVDWSKVAEGSESGLARCRERDVAVVVDEGGEDASMRAVLGACVDGCYAAMRD